MVAGQPAHAAAGGDITPAITLSAMCRAAVHTAHRPRTNPDPVFHGQQSKYLLLLFALRDLKQLIN